MCLETMEVALKAISSGKKTPSCFGWIVSFHNLRISCPLEPSFQYQVSLVSKGKIIFHYKGDAKCTTELPALTTLSPMVDLGCAWSGLLLALQVILFTLQHLKVHIACFLFLIFPFKWSWVSKEGASYVDNFMK